MSDHLQVKPCRSCGAPMIWVLTKNDKRMPMDAEPVFAYVLDPLAEQDPAKGFRMVRVATYQSHFVTCPQADEHRRTAAPDA